jgi:hypothetical protein
MKVQHPFKTLKYPFLVDIEVDGERLIALTSDNLKMKIYQKNDGKMVELLKIIGKSTKGSSTVNIALGKKARKLLHLYI